MRYFTYDSLISDQAHCLSEAGCVLHRHQFFFFSFLARCANVEPKTSILNFWIPLFINQYRIGF